MVWSHFQGLSSLQCTLANPPKIGSKRWSKAFWISRLKAMISLLVKYCEDFKMGSLCTETHKHPATEGILHGVVVKIWYQRLVGNYVKLLQEVILLKGAIPASEVYFTHNTPLHLLIFLLTKILKSQVFFVF